ncbi:MAG: DNA mismatch repair protein MutS [Dehalococcoidia bacterium]
MTTPARIQYLKIKDNYPNEILFFRMGDFYETFDNDAKILSKELQIALTSREMGKGNKIPLAGIPFHAIDNYLPQLINNGYRVAICEQTSDPKDSKGIVDRSVVRVVTAGTVIEDNLIDKNLNNFLMCLVTDDQSVGIAYIDITTCEFLTTEVPIEYLQSEIARINPKEIVVSNKSQFNFQNQSSHIIREEHSVIPYLESGEQILKNHFKVKSLEAFGCSQLDLATRASAGIISYVQKNQPLSIPNITNLKTFSTKAFMTLDSQTINNLELFKAGRSESKNYSLYNILNFTHTPMGSRLLRNWISQPLLDINEIYQRSDTISEFKNSPKILKNISDQLETISDLQRLISKVNSGSANPRDLLAISSSLQGISKIKLILKDSQIANFEWLNAALKSHSDIINLISSSINHDASTLIGNGKTIQKGFSKELDNLINISQNSQTSIANLENKEKGKSGIKSLKIGFNRVFGYYIEISKSNLSQVPEGYIRKQTLVGAERFITEELKIFEDEILNAKEKIENIENDIFKQICNQISLSIDSILDSAKGVSIIDVLYSLTTASTVNNYVKPTISNNLNLEINDSRHPVVEKLVPRNEYIVNDIKIGGNGNKINVLTGPNMAGKSTYLRQVGLITLMAQIGCFVPASSAEIGLVDRIFTRVGLQDDLSVGQSTFMVEMVETASILNNATSQSLILLDEIGRGTSTYDGLAIAQSVVEFIHNHPALQSKTIFATHYHEMIEVAENLENAKNLQVTVEENSGNIIFLRKIAPGGAGKSYGIHVADLAGIPKDIIERAKDLLQSFEKSTGPNKNHSESSKQLSLIPSENHEIKRLLSKININEITPLQALTILDDLQEKFTKI